MHGNRRHSDLKRPVQNLIEMITAFGRIINAATHFNRHGDRIGNHIPRPLHNFQHHVRLSQMESAAAASEYFLYGASKVDIDDIETGFHQFYRTCSKLLGFGTHQLPGHRVLFFTDMQKMAGTFAFLKLHKEFVEHHLANRVGSSLSLGDDPHRPVAVARQGRLDHRKIQGQVADLESWQSQRSCGNWGIHG